MATFQGDPAQIDDAIQEVRGQVESEQVPAGLDGVRMMMLVDRESGKGFGITLYDSEEKMRRGDEALQRYAGRRRPAAVGRVLRSAGTDNRSMRATERGVQ